MNTRQILGIVAAVAAGAAAGFALGMLYAPDKGTNTRNKIVQRGSKLMDDFRERVEKSSQGVHSNFAGTPQEEVSDVNTML
jgi:gas vesicle protein